MKSFSHNYSDDDLRDSQIVEFYLDHDSLDNTINDMIYMLNFIEELALQRKISISKIGCCIRVYYHNKLMRSLADNEVCLEGVMVQIMGAAIIDENPTMAIRSNQN